MQPDLLWEAAPPMFVHLPLVITPAMTQLEQAVVAASNGPATRLMTITGSVGVGKSTAGWSIMDRLGRSNRWGNCLFLVGDEAMTPAHCFAKIEGHLHYADVALRTETLLARFQHVVSMRRPITIFFDDADLLPQTTLEWLAEISVATRVVIGIIGQPALLTRLGGITHQSWKYPPASIALMARHFLPQLSSYGWFLPRRTVGYAKVASLVAEAAQGSLRRLYHLLFHARWLAALDAAPQMNTDHVVSALSQRRGMMGG